MAAIVAKPVIRYNYKSLDGSAIDKNLTLIASKGKALKKLAQETAVALLAHYAEHGDYTRFSKFADVVASSMSKSLRTAFIEWAVAHSSIKWDQDKKTFYHQKGQKLEADIPAASLLAFWEVERESKPFIFDGNMLKKLVERATNAQKNDKNKVDTDLLSKLEGFVKANGL